MKRRDVYRSTLFIAYQCLFDVVGANIEGYTQFYLCEYMIYIYT